MSSATASFLAEFRRKTGIAFSEGRLSEAELTVQGAMSEVGIDEIDIADGPVILSDPLFERLIHHLTVRETYFFRDNAQFEEIRTRILPLWREKHERGATLRAWSAGCASGEEPYSLAMLLEQEGVSTRIIGTDIARAALRRAERGLYDRWSLRGEGRKALEFCGVPDAPFTVPERIRSRVDFGYLNLADESYPFSASGLAGMDLILCRNVLIYFDESTVQKVARRFADSLAEDGWLITGPSDPPLWDHISLEPMISPAGVFYRRKPKASVRSTEPRPRRSVATVRPKLSSGQGAPVVRRPDRARSHASTLKQNEASHDLVYLRTLADRGDLALAIDAIGIALAENPSAVELHHVQAVTLLAAGRDREAVDTLRRMIYLDRSLAVAHFLMATLLERSGDLPGAFRSYTRVDALCSSLSADEVVPFSDGESAAGLAASARANVIRLQLKGAASNG